MNTMSSMEEHIGEALKKLIEIPNLPLNVVLMKIKEKCVGEMEEVEERFQKSKTEFYELMNLNRKLKEQLKQLDGWIEMTKEI